MDDHVTTSKFQSRSNKCTYFVVFGIIIGIGVLSMTCRMEMFDFTNVVPSSLLPTRHGSLLRFYASRYINGTKVSKDKQPVSSTKPVISVSQGTKTHKASLIGLPDCDWPPPLYPKRKGSTPDLKWKAMEEVQTWFNNYEKDDAVIYLVSGGLLALYRDGSLVPGDSDIDIRYGFKKSASIEEKRGLISLKYRLGKLKAATNFVMLREWGDVKNGFLFIHIKGSTDNLVWDVNERSLSHHKKGLSDDVIDELRGELCLPARSPLMTHKHTRVEMEAEYGPHWFIKMPFKSMMPDRFLSWSRPGDSVNGYWKKCIEIIHQIDSNEDLKISVEEINDHVTKDGIDVNQYNRQISPRDRCRAAAMLTFLLDFDKSPYAIKDDDIRHWHANHTLFTFSHCDSLSSYIDISPGDHDTAVIENDVVDTDVDDDNTSVEQETENDSEVIKINYTPTASERLHQGVVMDLPDCNWPPPLYPNRKGIISGSKWKAMQRVQSWFDHHEKDDVVLYLTSGALLGLYRDGSLVKGDSDIDIRYEFKKDASPEAKRSFIAMNHRWTLSLNRLSKWGDVKNGFLYIHSYGTTDTFSWDENDPSLSNHRKKVTGDVIDELRNELCLPARSPLQTHKHTRAEMEDEYGPHWFIKMVSKSVMPISHGKDCMRVIKLIDVNGDALVTVGEIDDYVIKDGIDVEQYNRQISPRDRCRAAAMLTFILEYDKSPYKIKDGDIKHWRINNTLFAFPHCETTHVAPIARP